MKNIFLALIILFSFTNAFSQETFPVNGVKDKRDLIMYAFTNATIVSDYKTILSNATLLIQDGIIVASGAKVAIPKGAVIVDLKGKFIYPSFIDIYSNYGVPLVRSNERSGHREGPQIESSQKGPYNWNEAIKPGKKATLMFKSDLKEAQEMRILGFGSVLTHQADGISRGTSSLVSLADDSENVTTLAGEAAAHYSFSKGKSSQDYPSSLMGSIALLKQTFLDAQWYKSLASNKEYNTSLEEWNKTQNLPQIFEATDKLTVLRADKLGDEFKVQYIIKTSGDEYQRIEDVKATNAALIVPLNFPSAYDVEDPFDARIVSIEDLKHWEMAPANAGILEQQEIDFALTLADLKDKKDFSKNLLKAIKYGMSKQKALQALTETPARLLKMEHKIGALRPGMIANFIITSDTLFTEKNILYENWVQGKQYKIQDIALEDIRGEYSLNIGKELIYKLKISGENLQPKAEIIYADTTNKPKVDIQRTGELITISFNTEDKKAKESIRLSGKINFKSAIWDGKGQLADGTWVNWSAVKKGNFDPANKKDTTDKKPVEIGKVSYPFTAYGWNVLPEAKTYLIKNATVWTNEKDGILNSDVLIKNGKIAGIGANLDTTAAIIIDGKGKHLTPGFIDEHSHIAISKGVNEGTQAVTSEVSIADVVNSEDVNIYRQLSGGVTASQLLHGSANPIGGQSALIKLRWGMAPEKMKINGADGFIKFALGENVKQANWGDSHHVRFPQTRMGVEQVFYDAFSRAKEYEQEWKSFNDQKPKAKEKANFPRRDLELEALVEILNKKRFISCHSYVQSEISMLMHVADSMGFKINTFTHILEGYKLADKMKAHGAGGSTFSDWWAYKYEVNDAIPYNAAIMNKMGIVTAINSDDAEMGRRLNHEAAKTVKYGGVSEEDALKMITLNPAKLLHLDDKMGSIKTGKDADLVLWSDNPLSVYAKAEKTFVDGILFFDRSHDLVLREEMKKERSRIINKMLQAKKDGEKTQKPEIKKQIIYHCETLHDSEEGHEH
ncbi:MAG: amidohydrolase family protein [Bacteroidetes bacterium]|nr:amidohydrolase family protein [Bacteroidota bacterium]HET6245623.1 amidohydrolase family protein [Bacteroidia bacterium]